MNNYWLAKIEKPTILDKIEIRQVLFDIRDQVFEYINSQDILHWKSLSNDVKDFIVKLMFEYYKNHQISHFGVAKYLEDGMIIVKVSIQPREWTEYVSVEFILTEPQDAIYY